MGWNFVRVPLFAALAVVGTTSCMIVNLDGDDGCRAGKHVCGGAHTEGHNGENGAGPNQPPRPPGIRPGVVQIYKVVGTTETPIGFGSQDPANASFAHWVLADDHQYPVNLLMNQSLKLKLLSTENETPAQLCTRAASGGIVNPKVWRVSQEIDSSWPCPAQ